MDSVSVGAVAVALLSLASGEWNETNGWVVVCSVFPGVEPDRLCDRAILALP